MNKYVVLAVVSLGIAILSLISILIIALEKPTASVWGVVISLTVATVLLLGLMGRFRLALQWGRVLGLFLGSIWTFSAVLMVVGLKDEPDMWPSCVLAVTLGFPLFIMFFALGTRGAREYFRVICPECGSSKVKGGNFFFTKAQCRKCSFIWE